VKFILFFLLPPVFASSQTVNVKDNKIVYKGTVKVAYASPEQLVVKVKQMILHLDDRYEPKISQNDSETTRVWFQGVMKLSSTDHVSRKVEYTGEIKLNKGGYEYRIDSIYLFQKEPGYPGTRIPSEELLKKMESSGPVAASTERLLNEIDMNFQKLIDQINNDMSKM
jgi:hypothetical protein